MLGGGSNLVVADEGFDGTVVQVANTGSKIDSLGDGRVALTVEAGEDWDAVVCRTVEAGLGGLECLSGIPGSVGATPVQNVGAYGVEIAQLLISVDLLRPGAGEIRTLGAEELGLGYRTSVLKGTERAVVLRVRFELADGGQSAPIRYTELARVLGVRQGRQVPVEPGAAGGAGAAARQGHGARRGRPRHVERGLVLHEPDRAQARPRRRAVADRRAGRRGRAGAAVPGGRRARRSCRRRG